MAKPYLKPVKKQNKMLTESRTISQPKIIYMVMLWEIIYILSQDMETIEFEKDVYGSRVAYKGENKAYILEVLIKHLGQRM